MKPQRFKPMQPITPNKKSWTPLAGNPHGKSYYPQFGEVYHVRKYDALLIEGDWYMFIHGLPSDCIYNESGFDPVVSDTVLEKELSTITEKV